MKGKNNFFLDRWKKTRCSKDRVEKAKGGINKRQEYVKVSAKKEEICRSKFFRSMRSVH